MLRTKAYPTVWVAGLVEDLLIFSEQRATAGAHILDFLHFHKFENLEILKWGREIN